MPRLTSFAPQFLVDGLPGAIAFYRDVLGFAFGEVWGGFYAIGLRDGFEVHLKEAPKIPPSVNTDAMAGISKTPKATSWLSARRPRPKPDPTNRPYFTNNG